MKPKFSRDLPLGWASDYETRYLVRLPPGASDEPITREGLIFTVSACDLGRYHQNSPDWTWAKVSDCPEFFLPYTTFRPDCTTEVHATNKILMDQCERLESKIREIQRVLSAP